jgi:excisionase family DNA binding protein
MSNDVVDGLRTLSVRQLAVSMGLPTWRIYEMIALDAAPPFMRIGKTYRFRVREVDEWMQQQTKRRDRDDKVQSGD